MTTSRGEISARLSYGNRPAFAVNPNTPYDGPRDMCISVAAIEQSQAPGCDVTGSRTGARGIAITNGKHDDNPPACYSSPSGTFVSPAAPRGIIAVYPSLDICLRVLRAMTQSSAKSTKKISAAASIREDRHTAHAFSRSNPRGVAEREISNPGRHLQFEWRPR